MTVELSAGIRLLSGHLFDYNAPGDCPVEIEDIANALSNICRFAGHLPRFYSVAQHAYNVSLLVPPDLALTGLMHDTAEAFTNDLPTPLKYAVPIFKELEDKIEAAMAARFGFQFPLPWAVKLADLQMLGLEKTHIKGDDSEWSVLAGIEYRHLSPAVRLDRWSPEKARSMFLDRYAYLVG
jgi:uncharacterized protein